MPMSQNANRLEGFEAAGNINPVGIYTWNPIALAWEKQLPITGGGGGGGGPVTIADGADVAQGATTDAAGANTVVGKLKAIALSLAGILSVDVTDRVARLLGHVTVDNVSLAVTVAALPLPAGASTSANQVTEIASLANLDVPLSTRLKPADTLAAVTLLGAIVGALPAGNNLIGKVGIDQTTPGTTNAVSITGAVPLPAGAALEAGGVLAQHADLLRAILGELRVMNAVIAEGLSVRSDLDTLRADPYYNPTLQ